TEFLPVSSSAHVRVAGELLMPGQEPGAAFTAIIQLGTETAVLIYFWNDITRIIGKWFRALAGKVAHSDPDVRMGWLVIIGSIPIGVLGLLFEEQIDHGLRNLYITAIMLIAFGVLLGLADRIGTQRKDLTQLTVRDGILFGFAQALALIPGVSRSGGTITAGLVRELLPHVRPPLLLPARGPGRVRLRPVQGSQGGPGAAVRRRPGRGGGRGVAVPPGDHRRDFGVLRPLLHGDRLVHAPDRDPQDRKSVV